MQIQLNGDPHELGNATTVAELLESLQLTNRRLAVELNGEILPGSLYAETKLNPDDRLEVVHAIGGGQYRDND